MLKFLLASSVILVVLLGWVLVQQFARRFARENPQWGPYREKIGCGGNCKCAGGGSCQSR